MNLVYVIYDELLSICEYNNTDAATITTDTVIQHPATALLLAEIIPIIVTIIIALYQTIVNLGFVKIIMCNAKL